MRRVHAIRERDGVSDSSVLVAHCLYRQQSFSGQELFGTESVTKDRTWRIAIGVGVFPQEEEFELQPYPTTIMRPVSSVELILVDLLPTLNGGDFDESGYAALSCN
jgi:hypothetical protein